MKNNIKAIRKNKGMSQETLAQKCNVSRQTINAIENDRYDPTLKLACRLAKVLATAIEQVEQK